MRASRPGSGRTARTSASRWRATAPGQAWSTPADLSDPGQNATAPSIALGSTGYGAIAWTRSDGSHVRVQVSRRLPGAAFVQAQTVSDAGVDAGPGTSVAVDPAGDVVVVWIEPLAAAVRARRFSAATGQWGAVMTLDSAPVDNPFASVQVVLSPTGVATATWLADSDGTNLGFTFQVHTSSQAADGGAWSTVHPVTAVTSPTESGSPQLAVDAGGNVTLVWFEYTLDNTGSVYTNGTVFTAGAGPNGVFGAPVTLSDPMQLSDSPRVAATPAGEVTVAWTQAGSDQIDVLTRPVGGSFPPASSATSIVPNDRSLSTGLIPGTPPTPFSSLRVAAGPAGVVVAFGRSDETMTMLAEAVYRPAGSPWPNPATTLPTVLSAPGTSIGARDSPSLALDGAGNAVVAWSRDTLIQAAALDVSAPAFVSVNVPATGSTGQPIAMSAPTLDTWSALGAGQPAWNFGDGILGAGATTSHVFTAPGTYTVTVGAVDAVGNASAPVTRPIVISGAAPPPPGLPATTIGKPKLKAAYRASRLVGSLVLRGTSPVAVKLTIAIRRKGAKKNASSTAFAAKAGAWTRTVKLPPGLLPGAYGVTVSGPGVASSATSFTLAAPKAGIVRRSFATGPRRGPAVTSLSHSSELWAHFTFAALPKKGRTITTQWILPSGKKLAANTRPRATLVEAQVKDLSGKPLPVGRWRCVIRAGGTIVATLNVRLK